MALSSSLHGRHVDDISVVLVIGGKDVAFLIDEIVLLINIVPIGMGCSNEEYSPYRVEDRTLSCCFSNTIQGSSLPCSVVESLPLEP